MVYIKCHIQTLDFSFNFYAMSTNDGDFIIASALNVKQASLHMLYIPMMGQLLEMPVLCCQ